MEETLGKRISAHRRRLGLTQDALAERLGVTAQAVSKWENDQSCPDITMLPKLSEVFGISTDEILGLKQAPVYEGEVVTDPPEDQEPEGIHVSKGDFEFTWDGGRYGRLPMAVWVLVVGIGLGASYLLGLGANLWEVLWPSALLVFGGFSVWKRFSFLSVGCTLFGGYFLMENLGIIPFRSGRGMFLPTLLLLLGLSLLADALRKPKKPSIHISGKGKTGEFQQGEESFTCATTFGSERHLVTLPRLSSGKAEVSFGELTVDLRDCEEISEDCRLRLECAFGELRLLVPQRFRVDCTKSTAFANLNVEGSPAPNAQHILADCSVSFGQITILYL